MQAEGHGKVLTKTSNMMAATVVGLIAAAATAAVNYYKGKSSSRGKRRSRSNVVPRVFRAESGHIGNVERFSHYVARQLGFEDPNECPQLCKLAYDYLRKIKGIEDNIFDFFANEEEPDSLYVKLIEEFDRCILSYFAFHWKQAPLLISQVMNNEESAKKTKLKDFVMAATRKQRVERLTKNLKVTRVFSTLVDEMKAISPRGYTNVMAPRDLCDRSPVLLLMGGGMGAGKSTVIKDILKEPFWSDAAKEALVVEADAFKERDVIYQALNSMGNRDDIVHTSELVHKTSTDAASSLLVTALNEGRDVIMDGTLSWEPFVNQTIAMARDVHTHRYRMGVGYQVAEDGTITENYWEPEPPNHTDDPDEQESVGKKQSRKPYRIELVGVVCDAYLAVVRGIRRAITTGRAVRVSSQLKSHKSFGNAFTRYCELVDNARLYCTNAVGGTPLLIAWKDGDSKLLIEPEQIKWLNHISNLNNEAESIYELYPEPNPIYESGTVWSDIVTSSYRPSIQSELKTAIQKIEQ